MRGWLLLLLTFFLFAVVSFNVSAADCWTLENSTTCDGDDEGPALSPEERASEGGNSKLGWILGIVVVVVIVGVIVFKLSSGKRKKKFGY
jgi:hypothetical protein